MTQSLMFFIMHNLLFLSDIAKSVFNINGKMMVMAAIRYRKRTSDTETKFFEVRKEQKKTILSLSL